MAGSDQRTATESLLRSVRVSDVKPKPINWLWQNRIALGKLTLLSGDPGLGKSLVTTAIATAVSLGARWPVGDDNAPKGSVVMLSAEDAVDDTIRPRLDAAGADCTRIHVLQASRDIKNDGEISERPFSLTDDIDRLAALASELNDCKLIVIDPVSAYLGRVDSHKNSEVRAALSPLSDMAEKLNVAVIAVTHLNKGGGSAMYRSIGSIAFTAAARSAWVVTKDRDDPDRRLVLQVKNNLARDREGMAYRIETAENGAPVVMWESDPVNVDIEEALSTASYEFRSERDDAIDWLKTELKGTEINSKELQKRARDAGHSWATVRRAQKELGIKPKKRGIDNAWVWKMPTREPGTIAAKMLTPEGAQPLKDEHLEHLLENQTLATGKDAQGAQGAHPGQREHLDKPQLTDDGDSELI